MDIINLNFDLSQLKEIQDAIKKFGAANKDTFPATSASFHNAAEYAQNIWNEYLTGGNLEGIEPLEKPINPKNANLHIVDNGDFESSVVTNSKQVEEIQQGSNPVYYDMKKTHPYGLKSRVNKDGIPYLIIPFRWGTPNGKGTKRRWNNVIPQKEYDTIVKGMSLSRKKDTTHFEPNAKGTDISRAEYVWKGRLKDVDAWDDRSVGMVRMKDIRGSTYFTFRIISAKSPSGSWLYWKDGKNAVDMLGALGRTTKPGIEKIIEAGIKQDLGI